MFIPSLAASGPTSMYFHEWVQRPWGSPTGHHPPPLWPLRTSRACFPRDRLRLAGLRRQSRTEPFARGAGRDPTHLYSGPRCEWARRGDRSGTTVLGRSWKQSQRRESGENLLRKFLPTWVAGRVLECEASPLVEGLLGVTCF